jgi:exopolysaccharide biosynthesis polyprenyl glycosylphosphotransferase
MFARFARSISRALIEGGFMHKERDRVIKGLLIILDVLIISVAFFLAFFIRQRFPDIYKLDLLPFVYVFKEPSLSLSGYVVIYIFLTFLWSVMLSLNGMYRGIRRKSLLEVAWIIIRAVFFVVITFGTLVFLFRMQFISRLFFVIFMIIVSFSLAFEKAVVIFAMRHILKRGYDQVRLLIVGTGKRGVHLMDTIKDHPEWGYKIAGVVDYEQCLLCRGKEIKGCEVIGGSDDFRKVLHAKSIDEVLFVVPKSRLNMVENYLYVCEDEGVDTAIAVDFFDMRVSRMHQTDLDGIPLVTFEKTFGKEWQLFIKRTVDVVVSGLSIVVLSPVLLLAAGLVKLTSPGPVFFLQRRVGLHGRKFTMYKFRSMYKGAQRQLKKLTDLNEMEGPIFKIKDDPRITPFGRFLRRYSIDELPQLFNVFIGRMSLVGPRPALPKEVEQYEPWQRKKLSARPGITCLWQIYHRGEPDFEKWMQKDLEYVDNWSLWLDFKIFFKTIFVVLSGKGAYAIF